MTAARGLYMLQRAMKEHILNREFRTDHLRQAAEYFERVGIRGCIYCGEEQVERWDHLIPVTSGGATVLGNMVPACQPCDDSKGGRVYTDWLRGRARRNPARDNPNIFEGVVQRVQAYQQHFSYTPPADFLAALSPEQAATFQHFSEVLTAFRDQLTELGFFVEALTEAEALEENDSELR
jgi:hypothetical protein